MRDRTGTGTGVTTGVSDGLARQIADLHQRIADLRCDLTAWLPAASAEPVAVPPDLLLLHHQLDQQAAVLEELAAVVQALAQQEQARWNVLASINDRMTADRWDLHVALRELRQQLTKPVAPP